MATGYEDIEKLTARQDQMLNDSLNQQRDIINQQTEMNVADLQRNKEDIDKDVNKTNKSLYAEYQKASNPYGVNAENLASRGLGNSGYAESTQTNLYNTYQRNVTDTLNNARDLKANFDYEISKARQSGNIAIAQSALDIYKQRLQLLSQEYDLKNNREQFLYQQSRDAVADKQWQTQFDYTKSVDDRNYNYQVGRDKIADSQWNQQFNYNKAIDDRNYNYQVSRDAVSDSQWQKEYELSKKASASSSRRSGSSSKTAVSLSDGNNNTTEQTPEVMRVSKDVIAIKKTDGSYATLNITKNATDEQIKAWGEKNGVSNILDYLG